jgi:hypothetical protein
MLLSQIRGDNQGQQDPTSNFLTLLSSLHRFCLFSCRTMAKVLQHSPGYLFVKGLPLMIIVYIWRSGRSHLIPAGHASLVLTTPNTMNAETVCTWFGGQVTGKSSSGSGSSSGSSSSNSSGDVQARAPQTVLDEWGPFMLRGGGNEKTKNKTIEFAEKHPNDPFAQRAAQNDMVNSVFPPSDAIYIRTLTDTGSHTGLMEQPIRDWWKEFTSKNNHYHFVKQNCSTITAGALIAGGATEFASTPVGSGLFWSPDKVFGYAQTIRDRIDALQRNRENSFIQLDKLAKEVQNPGEVWTKQQWYTASEENVRFYSRRYQLLLDIDAMLETYHLQVVTMEGNEDTKSEFIIRSLTDVVSKLTLILAERPNSNRKAAFGKLAAQCDAKIRTERTAIQNRAQQVLQEQQRVENLKAPLLQEQRKLQMKLIRLVSVKNPTQETLKQAQEIQLELQRLKSELMNVK